MDQLKPQRDNVSATYTHICDNEPAASCRASLTCLMLGLHMLLSACAPCTVHMVHTVQAPCAAVLDAQPAGLLQTALTAL